MINNVFLPMTEEEYKDFLKPYIELLSYVDICCESAEKLNNRDLAWSIKRHQKETAILVLTELFKKLRDKISGASELIVAYYDYPGCDGFSVYKNEKRIWLGLIEISDSESLYTQCQNIFVKFLAVVEEMRDK